MREIQHLIGQMTDEELRSYLAESLFLNTVKYQNDKLEAYFKRLEKPSSGHNDEGDDGATITMR